MHRKAKDTLRKTKMMRDASDRQVNQAMLGILTVILVVWMVFGIVCDCSRYAKDDEENGRSSRVVMMRVLSFVKKQY